eukprot:3500550-Heterocapsa_arctica.AAC.1
MAEGGKACSSRSLQLLELPIGEAMYLAPKSCLWFEPSAEDFASFPGTSFNKPFESEDSGQNCLKSLVPGREPGMMGPCPACRTVYAQIPRMMDLKTGLVLERQYNPVGDLFARSDKSSFGKGDLTS